MQLCWLSPLAGNKKGKPESIVAWSGCPLSVGLFVSGVTKRLCGACELVGNGIKIV